MARNRDPFTLALSSLRERIQLGLLAGGAPINVLEEAQRLRLSTTPVREALARLSGEGLVERAQSGGYTTLRLDASAARDRYDLQRHLLRIAIDPGRGFQRPAPPAPRWNGAPPAKAVSLLFTTVVCVVGSQVLWDAFQKVSGQLDLLRECEPLVFSDLEAEARDLFDAYAFGIDTGFADKVDLYHHRRIAASGALATVILGGHFAGGPLTFEDDARGD